MYRYESDYIMRMIHLLRLLFEYLAGLTDAQQRQAGEDAIRDAMAKLTGLTPDAALALSPDQLCEMLGKDGEGLARRYALAELLRAQGELHDRFGFDEDAVRFLRRSLCMYFSARGVGGALLPEAYPNVVALFRRFFADLPDDQQREAGSFFEEIGYYADAEDAFCAQDEHQITLAFYERLMAMDEGKIVRGGLTMQELSEGRQRAARLYGKRRQNLSDGGC